MGLDKWIKPEKKEKKSPGVKKKGPVKSNKSSKENQVITELGKSETKLTKFNLVCQKAKCKYQKTIMKKNLTERDKICPRCKSEMNIKK